MLVVPAYIMSPVLNAVCPVPPLFAGNAVPNFIVFATILTANVLFALITTVEELAIKPAIIKGYKTTHTGAEYQPLDI